MTSTIPNLKTSPPKFTQPELAAIKSAKAEAQAITGRMDLLQDRRAVKTALSESSNSFASGDLDLQSAVLSSLATAAATDEIITELRGACKARLKALFLRVQPLIVAADLHRIECLKSAASELETAERETSRNLGLNGDEFQPSPRLEQLRETHRRALEDHAMDSRRPANSADFKRLLDAIG
jgi:hypothetical protein